MTFNVAGLEESAQNLVLQGIRKSTKKSYNTAHKVFLKFCKVFALQPLPTSEKTLLTFTAYLSKKGLSPGAINVYLSAVRNLNVINGYQVTPHRAPRVKLALKAVKDSACEPVQKAPITLQELRVMWKVVQTACNTHMWQALLCLAFFGGLRCAEYTPHTGNPSGPLIKHVTFSADGKTLNYKVTSSKTKTHGFQVSMACSGDIICAKCRMVDYLHTRAAQGVSSGESCLFMYKGSPVSAKQVNSFIKSSVSALGWDPQQFSAHSLRAGAATTAARAGFQDWELKKLGNWASSAYTQYIRDNNHTSQFPRRMARVTKI